VDQSNNTTKVIKDSIKVIDTTAIINNAKTVILVQEKSKESMPKDTDWTTGLLLPILVAIGVGFVSYFFSKRKTDAEVKKLNIENENLKKSFQPIVIATLQSIQDKIVPEKIDALKKLVQLKNDFTYFDQQYCEGDPVTVTDEYEFTKLIFFGFSGKKHDNFKIWYDNYSYYFPDNVFVLLSNQKNKLFSFNESKKSFDSVCDRDDYASGTYNKVIIEIIDLFEQCVLAIRKDCHLDTSFIHDFIEQNK